MFFPDPDGEEVVTEDKSGIWYAPMIQSANLT